MKKHQSIKLPFSWSQLSSFEYSPEEWYSRYVLKHRSPESAPMRFGKEVGEKLATDSTYLPQVPRLKEFEHRLEAVFDGIPLVGYIDSYAPHTALLEYKTGKPKWTQQRADSHGQIDMYLLMIYIKYAVKPEDILTKLIWLPTQENGDFSVSLVDDTKCYIFETNRTTLDIIRFGERIHTRINEMESYALAQESNVR